MEKLRIDLSEIIKRLDIVTKELVSTRFIGNYKSVFKGRGLEFEGYKDYTSGDDASLIDWKKSKKIHRLLIKQFQEERNLTLFFLVDVSSTMVCGSIEKLKSEYAAEFIASLAYVTLNAGDSVGFAMFSDRVIKRMPPEKNMHHFYDILKSLANPLFYGGGCDLGTALKLAMNFLEKGSILIVVSDFIGLREDWQRYLEVVSGKFDVIGVMIKDPSDEILPEDSHQVMLEDPISEKQLLIIPNQIKAGYERHVIFRREMIRRIFLRSNCDFIELTTNKPFLGEIIKFFEKRARRGRG